MDFLQDYDFGLRCYHGKTNFVAYTLSHKSVHASTMMVKELELIEKFIYLNLSTKSTSKSLKLGIMKISNDFTCRSEELSKMLSIFKKGRVIQLQKKRSRLKNMALESYVSVIGFVYVKTKISKE